MISHKGPHVRLEVVVVVGPNAGDLDRSPHSDGEGLDG